MTTTLIPVILCGGSGTRLWPMSRSSCPKQFVEFEKGKALFKNTLERLEVLDNIQPPLVVCNQDHHFLAQNDLNSLDCAGRVIVESVARNTAPAIVLAAIQALNISYLFYHPIILLRGVMLLSKQ